MKTRIPLRKDADVLVVTRKQPVQFDLTVIIPTIKAISNLFIRVSNFFNSNVKTFPGHQGTVNEAVTARELAGSSERSAVQIHPNVLDEAARREYVKVISSDGMHVGHVERVFADSTFDQITHLLISREIPAGERKLIPIKWVQTMEEATVHLRVTKDLVEELADASIIW